MIVIEIVFWTALALAFYAVAGYPVLSLILAALIGKKVDKKAVFPTISFIIAAYNEEKDIAGKLDQTLELDYPKDKLQIIVASDGSTDRTDEIVKSYAEKGVILNRVEGRKGKTHALNETVKKATGEILIFSDATGIYNKEAVKELIANFNDPSVGCAAGRVTYGYGRDANSAGFKRYQKIAVAIRQAESRFGSQTSVSGSIHALRRTLFVPSPIHLSPDVLDAVHTVIQGYRVVYENNATSREESRTQMKDEFRARVRMGVRGLPVIPHILGLVLKHHQYGYAFQLISHKILRWTLWLWLLIAMTTNPLLIDQGMLYAAIAVFQTIFYSLAVLGIIIGWRGKKVPGLSTLALFVMGNAALGFGMIKSLCGKKMGAWEPAR
jgi:cellulose synthase/poly-beta-1,6-N-acetylglucosamine synthase-like glycosyltransferase